MSGERRVHIVDYGMGNLRSVEKAVERMGATPIRTDDPHELMRAERIILPGVGHFAQGMENLNKRGLRAVLESKVIDQGTPTIGICLGMQLMTSFSEEGNCKGLGWIEGITRKFDPAAVDSVHFKVPHMGWNTLSWMGQSMASDEQAEFYFCHSYFVTCQSQDHVLASCRYGVEFQAVIGRENIIGMQFHPEKSRQQGKELMALFLGLEALSVV